ncbi:BTAD domain-containing putative transcriptional regulator [Streptantibioticus rubrisoli]|uniref:NB-ARC domain-containing protein n=1 Tax=Streptantibioticus rubrisoli TaxID=1387313 RepID=A0ABT1P700_9ACTN|nr:BTAD domain-containing putative transcriptional regulator [Streptantibioticus rubrisoli]MCQ4040531.1 NB-ARC domain-containing protein [Streptantibioticus rubrisoli]
MLTALLLRWGAVTCIDRLLADVWGDEVPASAVGIVRTHVWQIRRRIGAELLESVGDGYRMNVPPAGIDAHCVQDMTNSAARAQREGRVEDCSRLLEQSVALWHGDSLAGVPGPFAERERERLGELRFILQEKRMAMDVSLGRYTRVIPELVAFTQQCPFREGPYGSLMRALYASGRQAEALSVFARARRLLGEELGIEPGPQLRALHERVLADDQTLAGPHLPDPFEELVPEGEPEGRESSRVDLSGSLRPAQLAPDICDFSGRGDLVAELCGTLTAGQPHALPVVALCGMAGVGKSALAMRVAHRVKARFPGGNLHIDLRGSTEEPLDPREALGGLLTALGIPEHAVPSGCEDRARLFRSVLEDRAVLLVLDDARDTAQVEPLLPGSARCAVVVTSRRSHLTGIAVVRHVSLGVFDDEESCGLLARIIGEERLAREPQAARRLVAACGNLPLAVRIAGSRLAARPTWEVADLADRLADERLRMIELRCGPATVTASFARGHCLLDKRQDDALRRLASLDSPQIRPGDAATALSLPGEETLALLESLADVTLLESVSPDDYRFHPLVRAFARALPPTTARQTVTA